MPSSSSSPSSSTPRDPQGPGAPQDPQGPGTPPPGYPDLGPEPVGEVRMLEAPAVPTAVVRARGVPMATIAGLFDAAFGTAFPALFARGMTPAGAAFALYTRLTEWPDAVADVEVGFPLAEPLAEPIDGPPSDRWDLRIVGSELPAGEVAVVSHVGGYDGLGEAWGRLMGEIGGRGLAPGLPFWECYVTEPSPTADPALMRTDLYCPVGRPNDAA